uniref:FLZ-type domain-containing protein n=2 Tax=Aegilops tauschii subsp. strangulata TaxID=200361 RepID=A0A453CXR8_AEGTS
DAWTRLVSSGVEDDLVCAVGAGAGFGAGGLPYGYFLDACFLCRKPIASNRDIFMYRSAPGALLPPSILPPPPPSVRRVCLCLWYGPVGPRAGPLPACSELVFLGGTREILTAGRGKSRSQCRPDSPEKKRKRLHNAIRFLVLGQTREGIGAGAFPFSSSFS